MSTIEDGGLTINVSMTDKGEKGDTGEVSMAQLNEVRDIVETALIEVQNIKEEFSDLADLVNITGDFTLSEGVTDFYAYKLGRLRFFKFYYQPTETGFTKKVIITSKHIPRLTTSVTVSTTKRPPDSAIGISSYFIADGNLTVVTPEVPSSPMLFTCVYLT